MKSKMKSIFGRKKIAYLLTIALVISSLPVMWGNTKIVSASETGGWIYSENTDGTVTITGCSDISNVVDMVIPEEIDGKTVTKIDDWALGWAVNMTSLKISSTVEEIGSAALTYCSALETIEVDDNNRVYDSRDNCNAIIETESNTLILGCKNTIIDSSITAIRDAAFSGCSGLREVNIPATVTSIGNTAFTGCNSLESIKVDENNEVYDSRENCNAIIETVSSTLICGCKNTIIPSDTTGIMSGAFDGCSELKEINIPSGVTWIGWGAFSGCSLLDTIVIPSSVTLILESAFSYCSSELTIHTIKDSYAATYAKEKGINVVEYESEIPDGIVAVSPTATPIMVTPVAATATPERTAMPVPTTVAAITTATPSTTATVTTSPVEPSTTAAVATMVPSAPSTTAVVATTVPSAPSTTAAVETTTPVATAGALSGQIICDTSIWETLLSIITFGLYKPSGTTVTITASETNATISYYLDYHDSTGVKTALTQQELEEKTFTVYSGAFLLPEGNIVVYAKLENATGQVKYISSDGLVVDAVPSSAKWYYSENEDGTITINGYSQIVGVTSLSIPEKIDDKLVTGIGSRAFSYFTDLTEINIPINVTSMGERAFGTCYNLKSIYLPASLASIGVNAFEGCIGLEKIEVDVGNKVYDSRESCNAIIETATGTLIMGCKNATIPNGVISIGNDAFACGGNFKEILIPNSVTNIGERAFKSCYNLKSIYLPASLASIGDNAFLGCSSLEKIEVDERNKVYDSRESCNAIIETATNTLIKGCNKTIIPNGIEVIKSYAFAGCYELNEIIIPNGVKSISKYAFEACNLLKSIQISSSVESIESYAFESCGNLKKIEVDAGNKVYDSRESCNAIIETATNTLVLGCDNTIIPNGVTSIGDYAIKANNIKNIEIPNSVISIGEGAFSSIRNVIIPDSVKSIGESAFTNCSANLRIHTKKGSYAATFANKKGIQVIEYEDKIPENLMDMLYVGILYDKTDTTLEQTKGTETDFRLTIGGYVSEGWNEQYWGTAIDSKEVIAIRGDGEYQLKYKTEIDSNKSELIFLTTNLYGDTSLEILVNSVDVVHLDGTKTTYKTKNGGSFGYTDFYESNCKRINLLNPWNGYSEDDEVQSMNDFEDGDTAIQIVAGDTIIFNISVKGTGVITPTIEPTTAPTIEPTFVPTAEPTTAPITEPTFVPTAEPTNAPTTEPTVTPTTEPTDITEKKEQTITAKSVKKVYGSKAFLLNASTTGDGELSYSSSDKKVVTVNDKGKVTIKGCGQAKITIVAAETEFCQRATKKVTITIVPKKVTLQKVKSEAKGQLTGSWKKDNTGTGYEVYISRKKNFNSDKITKKIKKNSVKVKNLKSKKKYYIKVRTYKKVGSKMYYGDWSKVKNVKVK